MSRSTPGTRLGWCSTVFPWRSWTCLRLVDLGDDLVQRPQAATDPAFLQEKGSPNPGATRYETRKNSNFQVVSTNIDGFPQIQLRRKG